MEVDLTDRWVDEVSYIAACPACGRDAVWASLLETRVNYFGFKSVRQLPEAVRCPC